MRVLPPFLLALAAGGILGCGAQTHGSVPSLDGGDGDRDSGSGTGVDSGTEGGSACSIEASSFDQSCSVASDCVVVFEGNTCASVCGCTNASIRQSALAAYNAAFSELDTSKLQPFPCPSVRPQCTAGRCVACTSGNCADAGAPPPTCVSGPTPCDGCLATNCCAQLTTCQQLTQCQEMLQCFDACGPSAGLTCAEDCLGQFATCAGANLLACGAQSCPTQCP